MFFVILAAAQILIAGATRADKLSLPPEAHEALEKMYGGDPDAAIQISRGIEAAEPQHPLGFVLEAEARWWKLYCAACEIKWGMMDAWKRPKLREDDAYLALADRAIKLAETALKQSNTAEMHLYAGAGYALKARLYGLREERRATAHAGVAAHDHLLQATRLDPNLADAYTGLGLYNYYVDTLSPIIKVLRFFMGIPGGNKKEGMRQLERAMNEGELTAVEARFYYAKNLRTYDLQYERALTIGKPLVERYPHNPLFLLLLGNLNVELSRKENAAEYLHAAEGLTIPDPTCAERVRKIAEEFFSSLH